MTLKAALRFNGITRNHMESSSLDCGLWVVGELGMVDVHTNNTLIALWRERLRVPVLVFEEDFAQLPPPTPGVPSDARSSVYWCASWNTEFNGQFLTIQSCWGSKVTFVVVNRATTRCAIFFRGPIVDSAVTDVSSGVAWEMLPEAVVLAATRTTVRTVNDLAILMFGGDWLLLVPVWDQDYEGASCCRTQWFRHGTKVMITRNLDVDRGLCYGAQGTVLALHNHLVVINIGHCPRPFQMDTTWFEGRFRSGSCLCDDCA